MKILILGFANLKYMPYAKFYLEQLIDKKRVEVHMLYWNRDLKDESKEYNIIYHEFRMFQPNSQKKIGKFFKFYEYKKFSETIIKNEKFDFLIFLHTFPAVLLYYTAVKLYKNHYIFDYRDITYEKFLPFRKRIYNLSKDSYLTFVSSPNYVRFMACQDTKVLLSHNLLEDSLSYREVRRKCLRDRNVLRIAFWGFVRGITVNLQLIDALGNDKRFELHYYGNLELVEKEITEFISKKNINNVYLHGPYEPKDRYDFASRTDIIHNIYEPDGNMENAIGNKFYDGVIFYLPQLCLEGSLMGKICKEKRIGLNCNFEEKNLADKIYDYYYSIEWKDFEKNCDQMLNDIKKEVQIGREKIQEVCEIK